MHGTLSSSAHPAPGAPAPREDPAAVWIRDAQAERDAREAAMREQLAALAEQERPAREAAAAAREQAREAARNRPSTGQRATADIQEAIYGEAQPPNSRARLRAEMAAKSRELLSQRVDHNGNPVG